MKSVEGKGNFLLGALGGFLVFLISIFLSRKHYFFSILGVLGITGVSYCVIRPLQLNEESKNIHKVPTSIDNNSLKKSKKKKRKK